MSATLHNRPLRSSIHRHWLMWLVLIGSGCMIVAAAIARRSSFLVVHEWGTFTSIAGTDGSALEWRPFAGAGEDLPDFVYDLNDPFDAGRRHGSNVKNDLAGFVRMETPVIYFYASQETNVSVRVDFPKGTLTEWYPRARTIDRASIDWGMVSICPVSSATPIQGNQRNHYYAARDTDAAMVRVCASQPGAQPEYEKFLFYRGVGNFQPPLSVQFTDGQLKLAGDVAGGHIIVFERSNNRVGYALHPWRDGGLTIARPELAADDASVETQLHQMLVSKGLYKKEADAMINTWRDDWFQDGLRVLYIVPRRLTDTLLPLHIDPRPTEVTRVLVGRVEVITAERAQAVREGLRRNSLDHDRFARAILETIGDDQRDEKH